MSLRIAIVAIALAVASLALAQATPPPGGTPAGPGSEPLPQQTEPPPPPSIQPEPAPPPPETTVPAQPAPPAMAMPPSSEQKAASTGADGSNTPSKNEEPAPPDLSEPLAGWSDGTLFMRSADNQFLLFPNGRLQVDTYIFKRNTNQMPNDSFLLRRARLEAFGWIGPWFGFNIAGDFASAPPAAADPVAQSWIATTDNYIMIAPYQNLAMLQVGQYDAPFTLENRTSDKYFDFMERSLTVRTFGIPSNKEVGAMVHGLLPNSVALYSIGMFNGDGQNFYNVDNKFDFMGRVWISPANIAGLKAIENAEIGASYWHGTRGATGLAFKPFTTQGGFAFSTTSWTTTMMTGMTSTMTKNELHQNGVLNAWALEADLPIMHRAGVRFEYVHKKQDLSIDNVTTAGTAMPLGPAQLDGFSLYGEAWFWIVGDDSIIGPPGLQLPPRWKQFGTKPPQHGVMIATRVERLDARIKSAMPMGGPSIGDSSSNDQTAMTSWEVGLNYWYSKRFRATVNGILNWIDGNAAGVASAKTKNGGKMEDELLFRLAVAL
jgi:hypothetical protein